MVTVPGFLLRRLYQKGSLKNTEDGFQFQLKNSLGPGYAKSMLPVSVDGEELSLEQCFFYVDDIETPFSSITEEAPFTIALNKLTTVKVKATPLEPGPHKVGMGFVVPGLGKLKFDVKDSVDQ